jgi:hypothetical protein
MRHFAYSERHFLHPPTTGKNSYICAIAESSEGGTYEAGDCALILADCHHAIELEFSLINQPNENKVLPRSILLLRLLTDSETCYTAKPSQ